MAIQTITGGAVSGQARRAQAPEQTQVPAGDPSIPAQPRETPAVVYSGSSSLSGERDDEAATLLERMIEAQKKAKEQRERFKLPRNTNYGDRPIEAYARLSRARNQSQVSAAAGYARRQIAQLRAAKRQDSENAPRIQAAINQLERVVSRAGRKKRELQREQLTEARSRRLEEKNELRRAQTLRQELRRRQKLRVIRERGYVKEAEIDDRFQQQMAVTRMEYQSQLENFANVPGAPVPAAAQAAGEAAPAPAPGGGELDIQA